MARNRGVLVPPYETQDTLLRLEKDIDATQPETVVCLGDSFDDLASADSLNESELQWLVRLQAGRRWIWIEGNHDPGPLELGGSHLAEFQVADIVFRHIAEPGETGEISGHYHPKAQIKTRVRTISRPCFLCDAHKIIMPAYGTYTGGLRTSDPAFDGLLSEKATAVLIGETLFAVPMPR